MNSYTITDACVGCTLCARHCPVKAISGEVRSKHKIDPGRCIRCGLCGKLCPKEAILDESGNKVARTDKKDWLHPAVNTAACVGCSLCVEACPKSCLEIGGPAFHGDIHTVAELKRPESCIGCGLCEKRCPIGAIAMKTNEEPSFFREYREEKNMWLYKAYCRIFQAVLKAGNYFMGYRMPDYIEGPGCIKRMPELLKKDNVNNILLVTGPNITKRGLNRGLMEALDEAGISYTVFNHIGANPTSDMVEEGVKLYQEKGCQAIIAFGGGSPMDCAKGIGARIARPNKSIAQLQGLLKVFKKIPVFYAVPTTAGSGSETTVAAVITDTATHHKAAIMDTHLIPRCAVLDPELTVGLPPFTTACTGMDALSHAVEAYTNHTYNTKLENDLAKQAVKLIYDNLLNAYKDGANIEARQNMQKAAFFAGRAFTRGCVGYVHAVGHTISGLYNIAHGLAMAVILPHVMRQYGPAAYPRLAELADVCGIEGASNAERANRFILWIEDMNREMGLPTCLDMIKEQDIPQMIKWAMKEGNPLYPTPVTWTEADFRKLIDTLRTSK